MNAVFVTTNGQKAIDNAYDSKTQNKLKEELHFFDLVAGKEQLAQKKEDLAKVDYIFSTWGMLDLSKEEIAQYLPNLKAVFYAAGSVQYFAKSFLAQGTRVFSAFAANAVPVAEYTVSQIILANKGFYLSSLLYKRGDHQAAKAYAQTLPCNYGVKVGIIGAGMIGKLVIQMLKSYQVEVMVFDPFLPEEKAAELGVTKASLEEIFSQCQVISNHLANNAQTVGMLHYGLFSKMKKNAAFINTGRGAQVVEADLVRALKEEPYRTAVLDVTFPEPVQEGHEFYQLDNVFITPHIAGSMGNEVSRMGQYMYEEYCAVQKNASVKYEVTEEMLKTMA